MKRRRSPIHPGQILLEEFLKPFGISESRLAKEIRIPRRRINGIVRGERAITADTALRLARYFGTSALFWTGLQARYDLEVQRDKAGARIKREIPRFVAAESRVMDAVSRIRDRGTFQDAYGRVRRRVRT
jgi:addiction module HigA family antidote